MWHKVLKLALTGDQAQLQQPVGRWVHNVTDLYAHEWQWFCNDTGDQLYRFLDGQWSSYYLLNVRQRTRNRRSTFRSYRLIDVPVNRALLHRTSVTRKGVNVVLEGFATILDKEQDDNVEPPSRLRLQQELDDNEGEQWASMRVVMTAEIDEIIRDIGAGTAVGVSDGSFKDEFGTASWIVKNASGSQRIMGNVLIPGFKSDHSAYRSEIGGIYALVRVVELIKEMWNLDKGSIVIGCDGINALYEALDYRYRTTTCHQKQFDLLSGIQGYIRDSVIKYKPRHVKGHQDEWVNMDKLDRLALLNIEVDYWAKDFWAEQVTNHTYFNYTIPKGMWKVSMLGYRVCKHLIQYMRESIEGGKVAEYWIYKRNRMTEQGYFQVDWEANKDAMKAVKVSRRHWVSKFESGMCGSGKMMKIWKQRLVDNCPRCNAPCETPSHIIKCPSSSANVTWNKSMVKLTEWLKLNKTCPDIVKLILHGMYNWRRGEEITPLTNLEFEDVHRIYGAQLQIGWRPFMGGCISFEWAKVQGDYYKWIGRKKTGKRWAVALIQKL